MRTRTHEPRVTTTHAAWGAGNPRLIVTGPPGQRTVPLLARVTTIGSGDRCTLVLPGAAALHADVRHDLRDEYVLTMYARGETSGVLAAGGADGLGTETLRQGARFTVGPWRVVFMREEFADHGRPYGGREGGEWSHQRPQTARPDYANPLATAERQLERYDE